MWCRGQVTGQCSEVLRLQLDLEGGSSWLLMKVPGDGQLGYE